MATLDQSINASRSNLVPSGSVSQPPLEFDPSLFPRRSSVQVSPLPYLPGTFPSTNSIINYSFGGKIPQSRAPLPASSVSGGGSTISSTTVVAGSSSSSSSTNNPPKSQIASLSTPNLNPGDQFQSGLLMAKSFYLYQLSVNGPVRVRLYATSASQSADSSRDLNTPIGLATGQGLISDVEMDGAGVWLYSDTVGSNGDTPQSNFVYLTVDNIGGASETALIAITYVPMQS